MKNIFKLSFIAFLALLAGACENTELDLLNDPNAVTAENAELDLVYNNVVVEFGQYVDEVSDETLPYVRMAAMDDGFLYFNQDGPTSFDFLYEQAYSTLVPDIDLVVELAEEGGFTVHSGSAKIMKAYILFSLVDLFGDMPYSQAFQGTEVLSPAADDDQAIYEVGLGLLDEAIADLQSPRGRPVNDLFYDGDAGKWLALANSMKLRYYVTTRLVNSGAAGAINSLLSGELIDDISEDFQFEYSTNRQNPDSRHPFYADGYEVGPIWYMSNYMMWQMLSGSEKPTEDPRLRYYFYRQDCDETDEDQFTLDCTAAPYPNHWPQGLPWCTASGSFGDPNDNYGGYWGRAHGNADGIPPDDLKRTVWGLYPAGGKFDADDCSESQNLGVDGARGAGIQPVMLSSFVYFLRAEAKLTLGTSDLDARELLRLGVEASIEKVMGFSERTTVDPAFVPPADQVDAYVNDVLDLYDAATDDEGRLNVVMNEYRLAAHGYGLDPFNNYRRTGLPSGMQPTREMNPGPFPRLFWYPALYVNTNANASQRQDLTGQVFWDTNPAGFIQ